jgi:hypothetical protein
VREFEKDGKKAFQIMFSEIARGSVDITDETDVKAVRAALNKLE